MQEEHKANQPEAQNEADETLDQGQTEDQQIEDQAELEEAGTLEAEVEKLGKQVSALKDQVMRERAENDNLRKRQERELQSAHKFATERLIKDLIPVLDSLTLGIDAARNNENNSAALEQFIEGSEMTLKLLRETLAKHGVEELNPEGEKFNPELHEAVTALPNNDVAPNTVLHVAQKGYALNGRVIRAAQVIISKAD
ncbi:nucleotide exchange factor GrpE [Cardiobacteriaceae bacterium TAE3-ERU3]|nr:nucleotide exchange factor GrpE [Cardiobacteriaceae bacterium TAE3-ERU3]